LRLCLRLRQETFREKFLGTSKAFGINKQQRSVETKQKRTTNGRPYKKRKARLIQKTFSIKLFAEGSGEVLFLEKASPRQKRKK